MASLTLISKKSGHTRLSADTPPPPLKAVELMTSYICFFVEPALQD